MPGNSHRHLDSQRSGSHPSWRRSALRQEASKGMLDPLFLKVVKSHGGNSVGQQLLFMAQFAKVWRVSE
jgi:hypothetical protein